jgi:hypothetical protein
MGRLRAEGSLLSHLCGPCVGIGRPHGCGLGWQIAIGREIQRGSDRSYEPGAAGKPCLSNSGACCEIFGRSDIVEIYRLLDGAD